MEPTNVAAAAACALMAWFHVLRATHADLGRYDYPRRMVEEALGGYAMAPAPVLFFSARLRAIVPGLTFFAVLCLVIIGTSRGRPLRLGGRSRRVDLEYGYEPTSEDRQARRLFILVLVPAILGWCAYLFLTP